MGQRDMPSLRFLPVSNYLAKRLLPFVLPTCYSNRTLRRTYLLCILREPGDTKRVERLAREKYANPFLSIYRYLVIPEPDIFLVLMNLHNQKLKKEYVANPEVGDIYRIRFKTDSAPAYYFLRINRISHDTVYTQANKFVYPKFVSNPDATDEFIKEPELPYTKEQLRQMLEQHEINGVDRNK
ncbi:MAG: hypothetical protein LUH22_10780 [Bacteroides sp.]|nr:hypothetical protein [Bacteroides sp.]